MSVSMYVTVGTRLARPLVYRQIIVWSHGDTTPGIGFGNEFTRVIEQEANRQIVVWLHENYFVGATPCGRPRRYSAFTYFI